MPTGARVVPAPASSYNRAISALTWSSHRLRADRANVRRSRSSAGRTAGDAHERRRDMAEASAPTARRHHLGAVRRLPREEQRAALHGRPRHLRATTSSSSAPRATWPGSGTPALTDLGVAVGRALSAPCSTNRGASPGRAGSSAASSTSCATASIVTPTARARDHAALEWVAEGGERAHGDLRRARPPESAASPTP